MIDILLRMKLMLTQIGDLSDKLNQTIQKAQKTVLDLQDNFDKEFQNKNIEVEIIWDDK